MRGHRGIVLYQNNTQASLIDECCGRVEVCSFSALMVGGMYEYALESYAKQHVVRQQELLFLPLQIIHEDFLFLHHIFEVMLLCAPVGSCVQGVFSLFLWLYNKPALWFSDKHKKFILFKLLSLLGIWPVQNHLYKTLIKIAEFPIDSISDETLELVSETNLEEWLTQSLGCHSFSKKMKTKLFLESVLHYD